MVKKFGEKQYKWDAVFPAGVAKPRSKRIEVTIQGPRFESQIYQGGEDYQGEWISREICCPIPPFRTCKITTSMDSLLIESDRNKIEIKERPKPTTEEHIIEFRFPSTQVTTELIQIPAPYDRAGIMKIGNHLDRKIPINPEEARFPDAHWAQRILVEIKKFNVL
jgi:hypothetical protein